MNGAASSDEEEYSEFVEVDPTGRYGRVHTLFVTPSSAFCCSLYSQVLCFNSKF